MPIRDVELHSLHIRERLFQNKRELSLQIRVLRLSKTPFSSLSLSVGVEAQLFTFVMRGLAQRVIRLLLRGRVSLPRRRRPCRGRPLLIGRSVGRCVLLSDGSVSKLAKSSFPSARPIVE